MNTRTLPIACIFATAVAFTSPALTTESAEPKATVRAAAPTVDHSAFQALLDKYLNKDGLIDYLTLRDTDLPALTAYLDSLAAVDVAALSRSEQLALYCNLYNATMMQAVATRYRVGFRGNEVGAFIFREPMVRLSTGIITLNHLEHELIRKGFDDTRIHAALVCAGLGCPKLVPGVFTGPNLDAQLDAALKGWVMDPSRNQLDEQAKVFHVSRLFKSYADDFGGLDKVPGWLDRYHDRDLSAFKIEYQTTYDWTPNNATPPGRWVWVSSITAPFHESPAGRELSKLGLGAVNRVLDEQDSWLQIRQPGTDRNVWISTAHVRPYPPETSQPAAAN
jgi:hypothetical protein